MRGLDPRRKMDTRPPLRSQAPRTLAKCSSGYQQFGAPDCPLLVLTPKRCSRKSGNATGRASHTPIFIFVWCHELGQHVQAASRPTNASLLGFTLLVASARSDLCQVYAEQRAAPAAQRRIKRSDDCKTGMAHSSGLSRSVPGLNENLHMLSTLRGARHAKSPTSENLSHRLIVASQLAVLVPVLKGS